MWKILVITKDVFIGQVGNAISLHQVVIEFPTQEEAVNATEAIRNGTQLSKVIQLW